ncbi:MAG: hypothetical protein M3421_13770 [Bacteroidota bacterium]|nr:hypothetical protein [Bacteroidota bacterium]
MKRHNENQMHKLYKDWLASGKSKKEFALENSITKSTFLYWIQKFEKQRLGDPPPARKGGFASLDIGDDFSRRKKQAMIRINYPSGISVDLFDVPDPAFVKTLIE